MWIAWALQSQRQPHRQCHRGRGNSRRCRVLSGAVLMTMLLLFLVALITVAFVAATTANDPARHNLGPASDRADQRRWK